MKAIRVLSVLLLIISIGIAGMYYAYDKITSDTEAPVINCDKDEIKVSVKSDEETLLEGVTVKDNKTKDVQKSLVIEKISNFTDANTRIITYAAIDDSGNVGRCEGYPSNKTGGQNKGVDLRAQLGNRRYGRSLLCQTAGNRSSGRKSSVRR
jgi:uncharacterized protein (UPF0333 family)